MKLRAYRGSKLSALALGAIVSMGIASSAHAATIFSTNFDSGYVVGGLNGQNGWVANGNVNVESVLPASTPLDVVLLGSGGTQSAIHIDPVAGGQTVDVTAYLNILSYANPWNFSIVGGGGIAGGITINTNGSISILGGGTTVPGVVGLVAYNTYDLVGNFANNTYSFYLNGNPFALNIPFLNAGGGTFLAGQFFNPSGSGGELLLDNYSVNTLGGSVPEPSSLILLGSGALMLGLGALRRKTAR